MSSLLLAMVIVELLDDVKHEHDQHYCILLLAEHAAADDDTMYMCGQGQGRHRRWIGRLDSDSFNSTTEEEDEEEERPAILKVHEWLVGSICQKSRSLNVNEDRAAHAIWCFGFVNGQSINDVSYDHHGACEHRRILEY
ncbi:unknown protein [Seminavis robusta]|uniref:Uncharacterized protein n=1 Tax=Seminavis robusta TaxID=568900 RepID=A0A9N8ERK8_9STRA|nr:unknown protein [Seminavis robusta]|eukprot:Sro1893_g303870.1 n/a (139) ;mRNA; r:598-1014